MKTFVLIFLVVLLIFTEGCTIIGLAAGSQFQKKNKNKLPVTVITRNNESYRGYIESTRNDTLIVVSKKSFIGSAIHVAA